MKEQDSIRNMEALVAALPVCKLSPLLQLAQARGRRRIRIALPAVPPWRGGEGGHSALKYGRFGLLC